MNILIYSQHFWPDNFRINDIALKLSKKHNIYVVSSWPSYNLRNKKKIFKYGFENYKKIKIIRIPTVRRVNNSFINIILNYLCYILGSLFIKNKILEIVKFDLVLSYATSPIYQSIPGILFAKKRKIKFFLWVQDLWPHVLNDLHIVTNKFLLKILNISIQYLYKKSDYILAQSNEIKKIIKKINKKTYLFYNPSNAKSFKKLKITKKNKKIIIFAGNIGKAQGLQNLIEHGKYIKNNKIPIIFKIIGNGSYKKDLERIVEHYQLNKIIIFKGYTNGSKLEENLKNADGLLVSLAKGDALSVTIPAKFQTYVAYGKPIFSINDNIVSKLVKKYKIGFVINESNFKKVYNKFNNMKINEMKRINLNCENLYNNFFDLNKNVNKLELFLKNKIK